MKILSIDIDNYGKLNDFHINFSENPYIIIEENGWGKSTLASFLRVMFFGFEDETKKKVEERERFKYKPWNNEVYGGSICFEANGKQYRLSRTFGAKAAEDESSLVDITTKLASNDFDVATIGEQLFGLNKDAYLRSLFLGQGNIEVRNDKDSIEDTITAKIGNLTEATDDVNNYEVVMSRLQKLSNGLKSGNKKGEINILNAQRSQYILELNRSDAIEESIGNLVNEIDELSIKNEDYKNRIRNLDKEYELAGRVEAIKEKENSIRQLKSEIANCDNEQVEVDKFFQKRIPDETELEEVANQVKAIQQLKSKYEHLEKMAQEIGATDVEGNLPTKEVLDSVLTSISKREECIERIKECDSQYDHANDMLQMRRDMEMREWRREVNKDKEDYEEAVSKAKAAINTKICIAVISGMLILVVAIVLFFMVHKVVGMVGMVAGILVAAGALVVKKSLLNKAVGLVPMPSTLDEPNFVQAEKELNQIKELKEAHKDKCVHYDEIIKKFCSEYNIADDELLENNIFSMQNRISSSSSNSKVLQEYDEIKEQYLSADEQIREWFFEVGITVTKDWVDTIFEVKQNLNKHQEVKIRKEELQKRLNEYDADMSIDISELDDVRAIEEIKTDKDAVLIDSEQVRTVLEEKRAELDSVFEQKKLLEERRRELQNIDERLEENSHKYDIINKTMEYLSKAKEQLSARYLDPIEDSFTKFYSYITTEYIDKYELDADINISRHEMGHKRGKNSLSQGYKDLVDISLRMALVDVMYKDEKPWIILDDPFVNLDSQKLCQVKDFIEEVSKEYQVIYFTCHESRA